MLPDVLLEGAGDSLPQEGGVLLPEGYGSSLAFNFEGVPLPEESTDEALPQYGNIIPISNSYLPLPDQEDEGLPQYVNDKSKAVTKTGVKANHLNETEKVVEYDIILPDYDEDVFEYDITLGEYDENVFQYDITIGEY